MTNEPSRMLHRFAVFTAACTLVLVVAGALVTSNDAGLAVPDWPLSYGSLMPPMVGGVLYEHGHRLVAGLVGILTILLAVWLWRAEERRWMRWLGLAALGGMIVQAVLGGLTVKFFLPAPVSVAHAGLAQLFFCTVVAIGLFTSRWWRSELPRMTDTTLPHARPLTIIVAGVIFVQLLLGAAFRHGALPILPHIFWAVVVFLVASYGARTVGTRFGAKVPGIRRAAVVLSALVGMQILLGAGAYFARVHNEQNFVQPMPLMVTLTVAHVALGALTLAASVVLALACYRCVRPEKAAVLSSSPSHSAAGGSR